MSRQADDRRPDEHDSWAELLEGLERPETQANPQNAKPWVFEGTKLFLDAGFCIGAENFDRDQLDVGSTPLITRDEVIKTANYLKSKGGYDYRVHPNIGAFNDRWRSIKQYRSDLAIFVLASPVLSRLLGANARWIIKSLDDVTSGKMRLSELVTDLCTRDLKMRIRLLDYLVNQLQLTLVIANEPNAMKARILFYQRQQGPWVDALRTAANQLGIAHRPDVSTEELYRDIADAAESMTVKAAIRGCHSFAQADDLFRDYARKVMRTIIGSVQADFDSRNMSLADVVDALPRHRRCDG